MNIICGDHNGDVGGGARFRGSRKPTPAGKLIIDFADENNMWISNMSNIASGPIDTFHGIKGKSTLDYILIPMPIRQFVTKCGVIPEQALNTSDHLPVYAMIKTSIIPCSTIKSTFLKSIKWGKLDMATMKSKYEDPVHDRIKDLLHSLDGVYICNETIDHVLDQLSQTLHSVAENLPKCKFRKHLKPFWCPELDQLKKSKIKAYHQWVLVGKPREKDNPIRIEYLATK